tara:strand:+ start:602 stop:787 length:186 start_codon:yes stop_codon:yes gene_type:complete
MSQRDQMAMRAMAAVIAHNGPWMPSKNDAKAVAVSAYAYADAMLEQRLNGSSQQPKFLKEA